MQGRSATAAFSVQPMGLREAISRALAATQEGNVATSFSNADLVVFRPTPTDPDWSGGTVLSDNRSVRTRAEPGAVFDTLVHIGGARGWYSGKWLWRIRGLLDQLAGGPGLRRGRRATPAIGEPLDFWRVEDLVPGRRFRLHAEMRLPGEAWLTWDVEPEGSGARITQTAEFRPRGLLGRLYWIVRGAVPPIRVPGHAARHRRRSEATPAVKATASPAPPQPSEVPGSALGVRPGIAEERPLLMRSATSRGTIDSHVESPIAILLRTSRLKMLRYSGR